MAFLQSNEDDIIDDVWQYSQTAAHSNFSEAALSAHLDSRQRERLHGGETQRTNRYSLGYSTSASAVASPNAVRQLSFIGNSLLDTTLGGSFTLPPGELGSVSDATSVGARKIYDSFESHVRQQNACADPLRMTKGFAESCHNELDVIEQAHAEQYLQTQKLNQLCASVSHLREEKHMWLLAHALYSDRLEGVADADARITDYVVNKMSEQNIAKALFERDSAVRESQLVVDWLESAAKEKLLAIERVEFFSDTVCWENTQHELKMAKESRQSAPGGLVTELDPDVSIRQKKNLSDDDVRDEQRLLRQVFALIRAGQIEPAQDLCRKCGEAWRAADLDGWRLFHDPNVEGQQGAVSGNPFRDVWKLACWESCNTDGYTAYERALVAAYSGNLDKLLPVCEAWDDYLWAYFKTLVDVHVEEEIRMVPRLDGRPWETLPSGYGNKNLSANSIFDELANHPNEAIRVQASQPFHIIEKHLVLNDTEGLLNSFRDWVESHPHMDHHLLRCMAHIVLFMRMLNQHMESSQCDVVLEAYVRALIQDRRHSLVATYTACLSPALQVSVYAAFLEGVDEKDDKRTLLDLAEQAGLDVARIAKLVVENIRCAGGDDLQLGMETAQTKLSDADERRIAALDWLVFEKSQRSEAVNQACALIRTFLATRKHVAARAVLDKIPSDSLQVIQEEWKAKTGSTVLPAEDENAVHELTGLEAYLLALSSFDEWFRHYHHNKPAVPTRPVSSFTEQVAFEQENKQYQVELQRWDYALQACTQDAVQKIYAVLMFPDGWLQDLREVAEADSSRDQQLHLLRRLCLPSLCFLLVKILKTTKHGRECLQIADVIASEEYSLYLLFQKSELQQLFQELKQTAVDVLGTGLEDPLGYDM